ncbi:MAG: hypothetical protein L0323_20925 [Planctomycetes bacterium]|nr:hypothetical protein [Planctomycetota bacterium]
MDPVALVLVFVVLAVLIRVAAGSFDKERIERYVEERGGRVISISWAPVGKGWFGERNDRLYEVVYYDRKGDQRFATCKTSLFSGVYWTDDRVSHHRPEELGGPPGGAADDEARQLREENSKLREELRRIRREHDEKLPPPQG